MAGWSSLFRPLLKCMDYMDDCVRSRAISVCNLVAITGPVVYLTWLCQSNLEKYPILLFLAYILISFTFCTFVLAPLQFGNALLFKKKSTSAKQNVNALHSDFVDTGGLFTPNIRIFVSCICCIVLAVIELYVAYAYKSHIYRLYVVSMICSGFACALSTVLYMASVNSGIFAYNKRKQLVLILESLQHYFAVFYQQRHKQLEHFRSQSYSFFF
ncbi:hypothetical protein RFI_09553, partial [Reticulomyxa filosa]